MQSLAKQMKSRMESTPDEVFRPSDFFDLGEVVQVNKILSRMTQDGQAWRLSRGLYAYFTSSKYGKALAYTGALAASWARKSGIVITEIGAAAANVLGFSLQNVMKEIFLTSGQAMIWTLDVSTAEFRKGTEAQMLFGNRLEGKLVRAWDFMGQEGATDVFPLFRPQMARSVNWDAIINADAVLPAWMCKLAQEGKLKKWNSQ